MKSTEKSVKKKIVKGKDPIKMVKIPGQNYKMSTTEITQWLYESVMGENPSHFKGENNPVEYVSWYDAIYFCNKLSEKCGYAPVYSVGGTTDVTKWNYTPHQGDKIEKEVTKNTSASGFRLPTEVEWEYAARGGQEHKYSGSNNIDEVAWYNENSVEATHPVAQKKANGYGLYDMSGNVWEWCWDALSGSDLCYLRGGSWGKSADDCTFSGYGFNYAYNRSHGFGFRVVRTVESIQKSVEKKIVKGKDPIEMVNIPNQNYKMSTTEVTQGIYESVMGENPSEFKDENNPVEMVSWYDAIYFCNKLSEKYGYTPVYSVGGTTDVTKWNYTPHQEEEIKGEVTQNTSVNGFRLPTEAEWEYAAKGGQEYKYSGSDNIDEVAWYRRNSVDTHPVVQKKANGYGLYDMSGNVWEWCWDVTPSGWRCLRGGNWRSSAGSCTVSYRNTAAAYARGGYGVRVVRTVK